MNKLSLTNKHNIESNHHFYLNYWRSSNNILILTTNQTMMVLNFTHISQNSESRRDILHSHTCKFHLSHFNDLSIGVLNFQVPPFLDHYRNLPLFRKPFYNGHHQLLFIFYSTFEYQSLHFSLLWLFSLFSLAVSLIF